MEITLNNVTVGPFKNLNICFFDNKITTIIGPTGSGKSILAEVISTFRKPNEGKFIIDKQVIDLKRDYINYNQLRFNIGIVMQNCENQFFQDNVRDHIAFQLKIYNYKNSKKRIVDSLKLVGLSEEYLDRKIKTLSDSERFEVVLASILSINPKVIILDDPTCFLDEKHKENLIKLLKLMKIKYNKTIIIFSNDSDFILRVTDYMYLINNGKVLLHGDKYEVFLDSKTKKSNVTIPKIIEFQKKFQAKSKISMAYRDNVNDLIKDLYYYIEKKNRGK